MVASALVGIFTCIIYIFFTKVYSAYTQSSLYTSALDSVYASAFEKEQRNVHKEAGSRRGTHNNKMKRNQNKRKVILVRRRTRWLVYFLDSVLYKEQRYPVSSQHNNSVTATNFSFVFNFLSFAVPSLGG